MNKKLFGRALGDTVPVLAGYMVLGIGFVLLITAAVTAALRFLPFLIFGSRRKTPETVLYLGKVLPCAIMGMLVVYCLRGMSFTSVGGFLPQFIAARSPRDFTCGEKIRF